MRKLFALLGIVVLALAVAVGAKTLLMPSRQLAVAAVTPVKVDASAATARLGAAVRLKTIASRDDVDANADQFLALQTLLQQSFPKAHAVLQREVIGKYGLVYTWQGSDPKLAGIGLMAHQDVVPIAPGTEGDWQQPPFSGVLNGGFVWGRGAWDDKGNLMSIMEAVELLAASGFQPRQTIYLIFGQDEEISGLRGALQIAKLFQQRGIHLQFVVDEGLLITEGVLAGLNKPAALVGVAEKGYLSVQLTANATPGHSSMPPPEAAQSAIGMMSVALAKLEDQQMPLAVRGLSREMFDTIAPEMNGINRVFLSNLWLFKPVIERQLAKGASTSALLRTTTALTMASAGNADNVLPGRANATVNFRMQPGDSSDAVVEHVNAVVKNPAIKVAKAEGFSEASKVAATDAPGFVLINKTLRQLHADVIVAPGLMLGATDSRHFDGIADNVYKFSPVRAKPEDLKRFHGTNERISTDNYVELIQFWHQLISNSAPPAPLRRRTMNDRATFTRMEASTQQDWQKIGAEFMPFARQLPDRLMAHLKVLEGDYGGFPVDRYTHSLQTATRALKAGRDEEYVVAALFHDIGDTLGTFNHFDIAAAILKPFVSAQNLWMVQNHGIFQGYYFFHHIGLDRNLRDQFKGHAHYERTAEFCDLYDNPAFDPKAETLPMSEFEPMVRRVFAQPKNSIYLASSAVPAPQAATA